MRERADGHSAARRQLPYAPDRRPKADGFSAGACVHIPIPELYGGETAARNNTSFIVFADKRYETKEEACAYLEDLGLIGIINEAVGTILLEMPEKDVGYGESYLQRCYTLHNALYTQKAYVEVNGERRCPAESEYCGGYGKTYMFGEGTGATL